MSFDLQLKGRSAVVTAASKGIGWAVLESLSDTGVRILACARWVPERLPASVRFVLTDLCTADGCKTLARAATEHLGQVDALVNVLGGSIAPPGGFAVLDDA